MGYVMNSKIPITNIRTQVVKNRKLKRERIFILESNNIEHVLPNRPKRNYEELDYNNLSQYDPELIKDTISTLYRVSKSWDLDKQVWWHRTRIAKLEAHLYEKLLSINKS